MLFRRDDQRDWLLAFSLTLLTVFLPVFGEHLNWKVEVGDYLEDYKPGQWLPGIPEYVYIISPVPWGRGVFRKVQIYIYRLPPVTWIHPCIFLFLTQHIYT